MKYIVVLLGMMMACQSSYQRQINSDISDALDVLSDDLDAIKSDCKAREFISSLTYTQGNRSASEPVIPDGVTLPFVFKRIVVKYRYLNENVGFSSESYHDQFKDVADKMIAIATKEIACPSRPSQQNP